MKLIFLDFDGVLTTRKTGYNFGDPAAVRALNYITGRTGAEIVVSSTWRYFGLKKIIETLAAWGVTGSVRGLTGGFLPTRGDEIAAWLKEYKDMGIEPEKFVILDDDSDMGSLALYLVKTSTEDGLQDFHAVEAIRVLE